MQVIGQVIRSRVSVARLCREARQGPPFGEDVSRARWQHHLDDTY